MKLLKKVYYRLRYGNETGKTKLIRALLRKGVQAGEAVDLVTALYDGSVTQLVKASEKIQKILGGAQ